MGKIGESLKTRRANKGLTLNQVEEETKIRSKYLQALEEEEFSLIPGRVYVKGFLRTYATFLGLNAMELLEEYDRATNEVKIKTEEPVPTRKSQKKRKKQNDFHFEWNPKWNKYLAIAAAVLLLFLVNKYYPWQAPDTARRDVLPPNTQNQQQTPNTQEPTTPKTPPQPTQEEPEPSPVSGVNLELALTEGDSWMLVRADGSTIFEGIAKTGETKSFKGEESVFVKLGNAGAVEITFNGEKIGAIGEKGSVVSREFVLDQQSMVR